MGNQPLGGCRDLRQRSLFADRRPASNDGAHGSILIRFRGLPVEGAGGCRDFICFTHCPRHGIHLKLRYGALVGGLCLLIRQIHFYFKLYPVCHRLGILRALLVPELRLQAVSFPGYQVIRSRQVIGELVIHAAGKAVLDGGIINLPCGRDLLPSTVLHLIQLKRLPVGNRLAGIVFPAQVEPEIHASAANAHDLKAHSLGIASRVKNAKQLVLRKLRLRLLLAAIICHRCKCTCGDGNYGKNDHPYHGNLSFHHGAPSFLSIFLFFSSCSLAEIRLRQRRQVLPSVQ